MKLTKFLLLGFIVILSACSAKPTPTLPEPTQDAKNIAAQAAIVLLAGNLKIDNKEIEIKSIDAVTWENACLGISKPGEMCAEVLTPGYQITLTYDGKEYVFRTNSDGSLVLAEVTDPMTPDEPEAVVKARTFLANELVIKPSIVQMVNYESRNWPDGCLGIAEPNTSCIQVITPGYLVTLSIEETIYKLRTNIDGTLIKIDTTKPDPGTSDS